MSNVSSDFTNKIKAWASYEKKYKEMKEEMNQLNDTKEQLAQELIYYMKENNLEKTALNLGGNKIYYHEDSQYNNLTFNFLKECLNIYFNNDSQKVDKLMEFIKSKRTRTNKPTLKSVPKKK
jgi:hypothetical protein